MKAGILIGLIVLFVLLSQAGIGLLAFRLESKKEAFAELEQRETERIEQLRSRAAEMEASVQLLEPKKQSLSVDVAALSKEIEGAKTELEDTLSEVRRLKLEEERLGILAANSERTAEELASLEGAAKAAQESLNTKKEQAALLEARVSGLMEDFERLTKDAAYVETAEAVGKAINERLLKLQETLSAQEEAARASAERAAEANFRLERASKELDDLEVKKSSLEEEILERRRELATLEGTLSKKRDELENSQESEEDASE